MNKNISISKDIWASNEIINFYLTSRNNEDDLYASEMKILPPVIKKSSSVLDIGCAAGGFSQIVKTIKPNVQYTGVDQSQTMIAAAKNSFPGNHFFHCCGEDLYKIEQVFDASFCLGVLHMTKNWKQILEEAWKLSRRDMVFDVRMVENEGVCDPNTSYQYITFNEKHDNNFVAPYVIVGLEDIKNIIISLKPQIRSLNAYGYWHETSPSTISPYKNVCMSVFHLSKNEGDSKWDLPVSLPEDLKKILTQN